MERKKLVVHVDITFVGTTPEAFTVTDIDLIEPTRVGGSECRNIDGRDSPSRTRERFSGGPLRNRVAIRLTQAATLRAVS